VPSIADTQTKVIEVVSDRLARHWHADEIHRQHVHLRLGQIYSALAYHYDHQADMDREIEELLRQVEQIQANLGESPVRLKRKVMTSYNRYRKPSQGLRGER
jgi:uncharacterized protein (DUF433 family)